MTELQKKAIKKTGYLIKSDIPAKHLRALDKYIESLSEEECQWYIDAAQRLYDLRSLYKKSVKVSTNAIKLCVKLSNYGVKTFPFIEKIATNGWGTGGGTYSFSMPVLTNAALERDIFSYGPIGELVKVNTELEVFYNEHTRSTEVDFK